MLDRDSYLGCWTEIPISVQTPTGFRLFPISTSFRDCLLLRSTPACSYKNGHPLRPPDFRYGATHHARTQLFTHPLATFPDKAGRVGELSPDVIPRIPLRVSVVNIVKAPNEPKLLKKRGKELPSKKIHLIVNTNLSPGPTRQRDRFGRHNRSTSGDPVRSFSVLDKTQLALTKPRSGGIPETSGGESFTRNDRTCPSVGNFCTTLLDLPGMLETSTGPAGSASIDNRDYRTKNRLMTFFRSNHLCGKPIRVPVAL